MILPRIRAPFDGTDAMVLVHVLGRDDPESRKPARTPVLEEEGIDALLDDPRIPTALLSQPNVAVRPALVSHALGRHALSAHVPAGNYALLLQWPSRAYWVLFGSFRSWLSGGARRGLGTGCATDPSGPTDSSGVGGACRRQEGQ